MNYKKALACGLAITMCGAVAGCGGKSESAVEESSYEEKIEVTADGESAQVIDSFEEGDETELEWFSYYDLNPNNRRPNR